MNMQNKHRFITKRLLRDLGYTFTDHSLEDLFLDFINEQFAEKVGRALYEALPAKERECLIWEGEIDKKEISMLLHNNDVDKHIIIEREWKKFLSELRKNRENVLKAANHRHTYYRNDPIQSGN